MRKLTLTILTMLCLSIKAQVVTMSEVFSQMPDSLLPYLTKNNKLDMVDFVNANMKAEITNKLDGLSTMVSLDSTYLKIQMNQAVTLEMKLLQSAELLPDSSQWVVCLLKTIGCSGSESRVEFYSSKWTKLDIKSPLDGISINDLLVRPDTMSISKFNEVVSNPNAYMLSANLSESDNSINIKATTTLITTEQKDALNPLFCNKKLYWNGYLFK